ncbi:uncharacterized protein [Physcomitrium patens]|uniref:RING-CH-type domain-containing protein n=1 Tax=Physcomitrium patens TaxID=3218 RepID=A0A2K1J1D9_PHYPA|nr:uncharacterized protein LOC112295485 [Physcomitrium patens]PNR35335.1 hypothetical protein PHYPA_023235 [Physcomitrium patens]|eukprot:XP_024402943.1 uncharacterized protein LOC112295485 [Physcomitrella patens]
MLQRFNSLIKGVKAQVGEDDFEEQLHVSLRPARSVDSSLLVTHQQPRGGPALPLARTRTDEGLVRARRRSEIGQTSRFTGLSQHEGGTGFVIDRVPEERLPEHYDPLEKLSHIGIGSSTDHREQSNLAEENHDQDAVTARPLFLPKPVARPQPERRGIFRTSSDAVAQSRQSEPSGVYRTSSDAIAQSRQAWLPPRVMGASSDAVVALSRRNTPADLGHSAVVIPDAQLASSVDLETVRTFVFASGPGRTISSWSTDSAAEHCRICQQRSEEPLIELGCACRGEMAKSHKSCIETWFKNKGTNKCEVCQCVAENIPAPGTTPAPHFWVWRLGGQSAIGGQTPMSSHAGGSSQAGLESGLMLNRPVLLTVVRRHPLVLVLWLGVLAFMTYLFVDSINKSTIGYAAIPIGFIFGVLVVLGLGTFIRLVLECCQERNVQRRIQQMEMLPSVGNTAQS